MVHASSNGGNNRNQRNEIIDSADRHMGAFAILRKNMRESNELCEEQLFSPAIEDLIS